MGTGAIGSLSSSSLQQVLVSALQSAGVTANSTAPSESDSSQLSPLAQLANTLQQLQESDPTKYKQVTQQVATNLQNAAQTAQSQGDSAAAGQLTQLAGDFTSASQTGQLPNLQNLSQAVGGSHHHHHHAEAESSDTTGTQTTASTDPGTIILQTLASSGLSS